MVEHTQQRLTFENNKVELIFVRGKETQTAAALREKEADLTKALEENDRYRKYLREIEESFKEMVGLEEQASRKANNLEKEHQQQQILLKTHQTRSEELEHANTELTQTRNELSTSL